MLGYVRVFHMGQGHFAGLGAVEYKVILRALAFGAFQTKRSKRSERFMQRCNQIEHLKSSPICQSDSSYGIAELHRCNREQDGWRR